MRLIESAPGRCPTHTSRGRPGASLIGSAARFGRGRRQKVFYGWWIVLAGGVSQAYTAGAYWQGFGAFFDLILGHFGWSRAVTSLAVSIQRTESGAVAPFVGYFIDKYGPRQVMLFGITILGIGFILLSRVQNLWQFYLAFVIITLGLSFGTFMVVTTCIANWFMEKRARALGLAMTGTGIGGLLVPLIILIINATSWRTALVIVGIGFFATGFPAAFMMRRRPEDHGMLPDGRTRQLRGASSETGDRGSARPAGSPRVGPERDFTVREALRTRWFWQFAIAMGVAQMAMSASIHQIPAITSFGFSLGTAGLIITGSSLTSMVGRLSSGFLGDVVDKRYVIAASIVCQVAGLLFLANSTSMPMLIGFMMFWGLGWGGGVPVRFAMVADHFGRRSFGSIMGFLGTVSTVFGIASPVLVGWLADVRGGDYRMPLMVLAFSVLVGLPLILTLRSAEK